MCCCDAGKRRLLHCHLELLPSGRLGGVSKYGGVSSEVSGEMFGEHLTTQKARVQRGFRHFGEILNSFSKQTSQTVSFA